MKTLIALAAVLVTATISTRADWVSGHFRNNGTYVMPYYRTPANGIQVVAWTDNRPPDENGRNGCRLEKGAISLQGHDPTTDLSFRNLRLAPLPRPKKKE